MAISHERRESGSRFWSARPMLDPTLRLRIFGRIQPMERPGLIERLFGMR
jgi:hypothetical protein